MATAQDAAIGFVRKLRPTDLGEVIGFDSRAEVLQKFTSNTAELEQAIRKTVAGGSTSLNNALYISLKGLKKIPIAQEDEIRRQAIILLSDGEDTSSLVTFEDVLDLARRSETAIYAIGLMEERRAASPRASARRHTRCASSPTTRAAARSSLPTSRASPACTARSTTSCRASTRSATPPRIPGATAHGGVLSCASRVRTCRPAPSRAISRRWRRRLVR